MKSKISCFNKTIFKKNLTQFWPLWGAYLVYMVAAGPINLYQRMSVNYPSTYALDRQLRAVATVFRQLTNPAILFVFSIAAIMATFSYLFSAKNANGIHALPVTRLELFCTNVLSAFGILSVIDVLVFIISIFVGISCSVTNLEVLFSAMLYQIGITFFAVAFASVIAMLTGHLLILPVYFFIANFLYVGIWTILGYLIERLTFGMVYEWREKASYAFSPLYYMSQHITANTHYNQKLSVIDAIEIEGGGVVAAYAAAGVLLFLLAFQLYRKRQLETAGDVIAVSFMKPIFRFGVGICGGLAAGIGIAELLFQATNPSDRTFWYILLCSIFSGIIGFFGAEMLMQKNFRVFKKRILIEGACVLVVILGITGSLKLDMFGLEKKLPDTQEVVYAYVDMDYPICFEGEDVEELLALHKQVLEHKDESIAALEGDDEIRYTEFRYKLSDGTLFKRAYYLPIDTENPFSEEQVSGKLLTLEVDAEHMSKHLFGNHYHTNKYLSGYVNLYDQYQNYFDYRMSEEELDILSAAIMKDIQAGNLGIYQIYAVPDNQIGRYMNGICLTFYNEEGIERDEDRFYGNLEETSEIATVTSQAAFDTKFNSTVDTESVYLEFGERCTNVIHTLEELGIVNDTWKLYTYEEYDALSQIEE